MQQPVDPALPAESSECRGAIHRAPLAIGYMDAQDKQDILCILSIHV